MYIILIYIVKSPVSAQQVKLEHPCSEISVVFTTFKPLGLSHGNKATKKTCTCAACAAGCIDPDHISGYIHFGFDNAPHSK